MAMHDMTQTMTPMLHVLGPIELDGTTGPIRLGGPKQQAVLALLVAARGQVVSRSTVIMGVWGEDASDDRQRSFHTYVSNLRSLLGAPIERRGDGYRIDPATIRADAWEFEDAVERCRTDLAATPAESAAQLREALGWWRGLPYLEASEAEGLHAEISRLEDLRVDAVELRADADLRLGRHEEVVTELDALVLEYPLRERLRTLQMLALYRSGRQAEALRAYERAREFFVEELGLDPSPELAVLQVRILNQDPTLMVDSGQTTTQRLAFLFTDIEGSTHLWELHLQDMAATLARHDEILSAAVADTGGRIFRDTGEGIGAVFPDVPSAAAAASQAQHSLSTEAWHPGPAIRARMAIDVGDVDVRGDEYFGPPLNRCGRVLAAGHGGQVLLSGAAQDDLALASVEGTQIRQLGEHRLRGLSASERIGQLLIEGLPSDFPPLRLHVSGVDPTQRLDGDVLLGYELRNVVGAGTFGVVYRAFQPSVRREVAVKVVRPEYAGHPAFIRRFEAEARLVASLQHPNIVPLFDYWRDPGGAYLVMQLMRGGSLADALDKRWETNDAIRLLHQVAAALAHGHGEGVVHGDLKPSDVLLDGSGNAYVGDFGTATRLLDPVEDGQLPPSAPAYRAPEDQAESAPDLRADIYSLGVLASELLTGRRPDATGDAGTCGLAEPVRAVLATASAALPEQRYNTVPEFIVALDEALQVTELANDLVPVRTDRRNPFKGLAAFGEADAREFFGREDLVDALMTAVTDHSLVTVVGPSGSGKSSLVRAGLVPRLRRNDVDGSADWFITTLEPGTHPLDALAEAIEAIADTPVDDPVGLLEGGGDSLVGLIGQSISVPGAEVLLLVDQFEELYTQSTGTERATFVEVLTAALTEGAVRSVITIRADFFDRALSDPALAQLVQAGLVPVVPLSKDELLAAIERPVADAGVSIEPGLATRMADEVYGRTGALPLLQFALTRLFDERETDQLTAADYEAMGGFAGAVGHQAEKTYAELTVSQQLVAEGVLLRLVSIDEESDVTRRRVRRSELESLYLAGDDVTAVIDRFDRARLLAFDRDPVSRGATVEIAHEAILTAWGRLGDLVDRHRESLLLTRRLRAAMVDWLEADHADEYLLHGDRLARYRELDGTRSLSADEQEFLRRSQEAEARAFRAAQRARRRRAAVALAAGLLALVAVIIVTVSTIESRLASDVASMRALVVQALEEADSRPDVALLLAVEAYRRDPGPESQAGLLSALRQSTEAVVRTAGSHAGPAPNSFCGGHAEKPGRFLSTGTDANGATEVVIHDVVSGDVDRVPAPFSCAISELAGGRIIGTTATDPFDSEGVHVDHGSIRRGGHRAGSRPASLPGRAGRWPPAVRAGRRERGHGHHRHRRPEQR